MRALVMGGLLAALPCCALAAGLAEEIARQMSRQGFGDIETEGTWLGRTRITGTRDGGSREIIVNPNTGEILRDLWLDDKGQVRAADIDLDGDDDEQDDKDEDNSGHGNSGSGGGEGSGGSGGGGGGGEGEGGGGEGEGGGDDGGD